MEKPNNIKLTFFAYGLFKPNEPAYNQINKFVENISESMSISNSHLWIRDGLPIINCQSGGQVVGYEITFREENHEDAYNAISKFVSIGDIRLYEWDLLNLVDDEGNIFKSMNILTWQKPPQFSTDDIIEEWSAKYDPMFTVAMKIIKGKIDNHAQGLFVGKPFEWDRFFELQMAYLLLWTAIERYCAFAYGPFLSSGEKRRALAVSEPFQEALIKVLKGSDHLKRVCVIYDSQDPEKWKRLNAYRPIDSINYYYFVRCNLAHRGKSEFRDGEIIRLSLIELFKIFQIVLEETLFSQGNPD
jgi:hypothetical protein